MRRLDPTSPRFPDPASPVMDVLAPILRSIRIRNTVYCRSQMTAPWGVAVAPGSPALYVVIQGDCWLHLEDGSAGRKLAAGELVVIPHGHGHVLRDSPKSRAVALEALLAGRSAALPHQAFGGGGATTTLLCGRFDFDGGRSNPLLGLLPTVIHVRPLEGRLVSWLEATAALLGDEAASPRRGTASVVERLTDVLLVQAVRWQLSRGARDADGWIRALEDPQISQALGLIHDHPEEQWTVESLAARVAMSRSAFAARFRGLAGEPPLRYLTRLRINRASELLRGGSASLSEVAARTGYSSSAALSKAFRRWVGAAPAAARGTSQAEDRAAAAAPWH